MKPVEKNYLDMYKVRKIGKIIETVYKVMILFNLELFLLLIFMVNPDSALISLGLGFFISIFIIGFFCFRSRREKVVVRGRTELSCFFCSSEESLKIKEFPDYFRIISIPRCLQHEKLSFSNLNKRFVNEIKETEKLEEIFGGLVAMFIAINAFSIPLLLLIGITIGRASLIIGTTIFVIILIGLFIFVFFIYFKFITLYMKNIRVIHEEIIQMDIKQELNKNIIGDKKLFYDRV